MKILRVFPRRTKATPVDVDTRFSEPGLFDDSDYDEIHISVTFTWDLPRAEQLARSWKPFGLVRIGGPATGMPGAGFTPGLYLRLGYTITSRGCPNRCPHCLVPARDGALREINIAPGFNVLDDNLLACSPAHIFAVFDMLRAQKQPIQFTGGLEAARLTPELAAALRSLHPKQLFFALDSPAKLPALQRAGRLLIDAGFTTTSKSLRCFVLIGHPGDTPDAANSRLESAARAGFVPMAMFYRGPDCLNPVIPGEWHKLQWLWSRPAANNSFVRSLLP